MPDIAIRGAVARTAMTGECVWHCYGVMLPGTVMGRFCLAPNWGLWMAPNERYCLALMRKGHSYKGTEAVTVIGST